MIVTCLALAHPANNGIKEVLLKRNLVMVWVKVVVMITVTVIVTIVNTRTRTQRTLKTKSCYSYCYICIYKKVTNDSLQASRRPARKLVIDNSCELEEV